MTIRKSGDNLHLEAIGETYDDTYAGYVEVLDSQQVPLTFDLPAPRPVDAGTASVPCWKVFVQADPSNQDNVLLGNERHGCYIVLIPGASMWININDARKIYVRTVDGGGTTRINWLAVL